MNPAAHGQLYQAACLIIPLVLAIVCHEMAHGMVARALGDHTAAEAGRLTFNPLRHVDPIGTLVLPGLLALAHAPVFGWAKAVPVNKWRLHNPRRDMMLVAAAGPGSNFVLAGLAALALGLMLRLLGPQGLASGAPAFIAENLGNFITINLFLGLFNLLPIPPFDGSHVVEGLLPEGMARGYARLRRYGMLVPLILIVLVPVVFGVSAVDRFVDPPFEWFAGLAVRLMRLVAGPA